MKITLNYSEAISINFSLIIKYFVALSIILIAGRLSGDIVGLVFFCSILIGYIHNKRNSRIFSVFAACLWLFIYDFFVGGSSFKISFFSSILFKPGLIFFALAFIETLSNFSRFKVDNIIRINILLFVITIISLIVSPSSFAIFITRYSFFYLYLVLYNIRIQSNEDRVFKHGLHLVIVLAILQVIVSVLQVYRYIEPSRTKMNLGDGKIVEWTGGLGDLASGTFGAMASPDTSWYQTFVFGLILCYSIKYKSLLYFFLACIVLLQYALVDSKTILAVSVIFFLMFLYYLNKDRLIRAFRFNFLVKLSGGFMVFSIVFIVLWKSFYAYIDQNVNYDSNFETVKTLSNEAVYRVFTNMHQWGKFRGMVSVLELQYDDNWIKPLVGFGPGNYTWPQIVKVLNMDIPVMKMNNFTRSFSSMIIILGELGIMGLLIVVFLFAFIFRKLITISIKNQSLEIRLISLYLAIFIIAIFLNAFIYPSLRLSSKSIFAFWFILILFLRYIKFKQIEVSQNLTV